MDRKQTGDELRTMNDRLEEALDLAREVKQDASQGQPLDPAKKERIKSKLREVIRLKRILLGEFPAVGSTAFPIAYRMLKFLNDLSALAEKVFFWAPGPNEARERDMVSRLLRILKAEKEYLESILPQPSGGMAQGFASLNNLADALLRRMDDPLPDDDQEFLQIQEMFFRLHFFKEIGAGEVPFEFHGKDLAWWYGRLATLDIYADPSNAEIGGIALEIEADILVSYLSFAKIAKLEIERQMAQ